MAIFGHTLTVWPEKRLRDTGEAGEKLNWYSSPENAGRKDEGQQTWDSPVVKSHFR